MNVTAPIRRQALLTPDAIAIADVRGTPVTYATLDRAIDLMAHQAGGLGLRAGDIAGLGIGQAGEVTSLILMLALARIGVASAAPSLSADHVRLSFRYGPSARPGEVSFDATWLADALAGAPVRPTAMHDDPDALLRIFASSGTTGEPKHIPVSHRLMTERVFSRWLSGGGGRRTRMIAVGAGITWGYTLILATLWQGGTLVVFDPHTAVAAIDRFEVEELYASPASLKQIADLRADSTGPLPSLQMICSGGSSLPDPLCRIAQARLCAHIVSNPGAGETSGIASAPVEAPEVAQEGPIHGRPGAVGYIWPDVTVQAVDHEFRALPPGTEGLLRFRGPLVADGYFADPDSTAERFRDGWFYSDDIGTIWPDGMLSLSGRSSDLINIGGDKLNPARIESVLIRLPNVTDAAVFSVRNDAGLDEVCAALVVSKQIDETVLNTFCRRNLPNLSFAAIIELDALPRNENGKVQRDRLAAFVTALDDADQT